MSIRKEVDVLVIGAGPSGSITSAILHKAGLSVQIVEKVKFPRFVIGESLLPRCMEALQEADLLSAVEAKGFQQKTGAKFIWGDKLCDFRFSQQYTPGWDYAYQVQRADFDKTLADACEERGVSIAYETEVVDIKFREDGSSTTTVKMNDGTTQTIEAIFKLQIFAPEDTCLMCGCFSRGFSQMGWFHPKHIPPVQSIFAT